MSKFKIVDSFDNHCFSTETFDTSEDGWAFLYLKYPVIKNADGTQNDREDELGEYYVVRK